MLFELNPFIVQALTPPLHAAKATALCSPFSLRPQSPSIKAQPLGVTRPCGEMSFLDFQGRCGIFWESRCSQARAGCTATLTLAGTSLSHLA